MVCIFCRGLTTQLDFCWCHACRQGQVTTQRLADAGRGGWRRACGPCLQRCIPDTRSKCFSNQDWIAGRHARQKQKCPFHRSWAPGFCIWQPSNCLSYGFGSFLRAETAAGGIDSDLHLFAVTHAQTAAFNLATLSKVSPCSNLQQGHL